MKIIFSRKGIDDAYGKGASPIMPDGQLLSIPIPVKNDEKGRRYSSLSYHDNSYQNLINQLGIGIKQRFCHHDPDLFRSNHNPLPQWLPAFGQRGAAASHLINQDVTVGDIFLFFGSFRRTILDGAKNICYDKASLKRHIIFGFLRIGEILDLNIKSGKQKAIDIGQKDHPHVLNNYGGRNLLYVAKKKDDAGTFRYHDNLVLSKQGSSKSIWQLPLCFNGVSISRHTNRNRFRVEDKSVTLQTVAIGQDFVVSKNQKVSRWANKLIKLKLLHI